jgi:hypothetical protein
MHDEDEDNNMVPHEEYVTGDEGEGEVDYGSKPHEHSGQLKEESKEVKEEAKPHESSWNGNAQFDWMKSVRVFPKLPRFPKLQSPDQLPQQLVLVENMLLQDGYSEAAFDILRVKSEIIETFAGCDDVYRTATLLINRPWADLKRHLLQSFAGTARMIAEANTRLSQLKFDRDLMANRIRTLYDWFSLHDSSMSTHEFITRVFTTKIFPARYLEKIVERAEQRYPHVHWRRIPVWDLCDIVENVCLLMAELEAVNPHSRGSDNTRRVDQDKGGSWLESWVKGFGKVLHVTDPQIAGELGEKGDESKRLFSKKTSRHYFLIGFKDANAAVTAARNFDEKTVREFTLKFLSQKPKNV